MKQTIADKERQNQAKRQEEMNEQQAREQVSQTEQSRIEAEHGAADQRAREERERQEKLRKEIEKKKAEQREKYSIAGHGNDIVTQSIRIAETSVHIMADSVKDIVRMSKELMQKRAESKELTEGECKQTIKTYETLRNNVEQLNKVNKNLDSIKDKRIVEKYETTKQSLEKKVCETLEITKEKLAHIYKKADILHCEPISKTADVFAKLCNITDGSYDNVADCKYNVPDYWDIGKVYARLIADVCDDDIIETLVNVYHSVFSDAISNYNSDFYYQSRDYIKECYKAGEIL